jgi:hypothetical protein
MEPQQRLFIAHMRSGLKVHAEFCSIIWLERTTPYVQAVRHRSTMIRQKLGSMYTREWRFWVLTWNWKALEDKRGCL